MIFRVYLRSPDVAMAAFRALVGRTDLDGGDMLAVLNRDGHPVAHHRFDGKDHQKWWLGRLDEIDLSRAV